MADDSSRNDGPSLPPKLSLPRVTARPDPEPETVAQAVPLAKPIGSPLPPLRPTVGSAPESGTIKLKPTVRPAVQAVPQPPPGGAAADLGKESTMRITLPEGGKPAAARAVQPQAPTIRTGPPTKTLTRVGATPAAKKETSRIPLESASVAAPLGATGGVEGPRTIRITPKPAAGPSTIKLRPRPAEAPRLGSAASQEEKKKTSRIPLDAALASDSSAVEGPKTIRLKRPDAGPALRVDTAAAAGRVGLGATAKIEETVKIDGEEPPTPTRRKTIKVKRPGQQPSARTGPTAGVAMGPAPVQQVIEDQPGWFFPVVTVLAIFVVIATIYVFAAEAIGPNPSLTQLSYYVEGPDLGMPMKIQPPRQ